MIAMHRATEKDTKTRKTTTCIQILDDGELRTIAGKNIADWASGLKAGTVIRTTWSHPGDQILIALNRSSKAILRYVPWHDTGIPKDLESGEILKRYASLPESLFRDFEPREDIYKLRLMVARYNLIADLLKRFKQVGGAIAENFSLDEETRQEIMAGPKKDLDTSEINKTIVCKDLEAVAKTIPECILFNEIADIRNSWVLAAQIVAAVISPLRFEMVSKLWKFNGHGVTDGKRDQRRAGQNRGFNVRLLAQWHAASLTWTQEGNRWKSVYGLFKAVELQQHAEKHPECKSPRGHCHAMALRLVRKEIMKEWWKASRIAAQSDADAQLRDGGKRAGNRVAVDAHGRIVPGPQDSRAEAA